MRESARVCVRVCVTSHKYEESNLTKVQQDTTLGDQGSVFDLQIKIEQLVGGESQVAAP